MWKQILCYYKNQRNHNTAWGRAGGFVAATAGGKTGAVIGSFVCPGIGTAIGGLLGILTGAAAGAVAGNTVGKLIDENVMRVYRCSNCHHQWRAA